MKQSTKSFTIRVLGHDLTVSGRKPRELCKQEAYGAYQYGQLKVYVNPDSAGPIQGNTLIHELLHSATDIAGLHLKHADIHVLAGLLHAFIRDNPRLVAKITDGRKLI
jgi:hypothetical protein